MQKSSLRFSIVIPALNEENYLPLLLTDLSQQDHQAFEVIVVDGGSTDFTVKKTKTFKQKLNLTVLINQKKNVGQQRNKGAKHTRGEYLIFFDADVRVPTSFLTVLDKQIKRGGGYLFTTKLKVKSRSQAQQVSIEMTNFVIELFNKVGKPFAPGFNIIIEQDLFVRLKGFDSTLKLAEDHDLVQRARKNGVLLKVLKKPILYASMRRPEKIGYLKLLIQYTFSSLYALAGEPIKKELYDYPMGGHVYSNNEKNDLWADLEKLRPKVKSNLRSLKQKIAKVAKNIELPF